MHLIIALLAHEVSHVFSAILLNIEFTKVKITIFGFNLNANLDRISPAKKSFYSLQAPHVICVCILDSETPNILSLQI